MPSRTMSRKKYCPRFSRLFKSASVWTTKFAGAVSVWVTWYSRSRCSSDPGPELQHLGELLVVDHHQQVVVRDVAAHRVVHPVAAGVGAEQDHLQDLALPLE